MHEHTPEQSASKNPSGQMHSSRASQRPPLTQPQGSSQFGPLVPSGHTQIPVPVAPSSHDLGSSHAHAPAQSSPKNPGAQAHAPVPLAPSSHDAQLAQAQLSAQVSPKKPGWHTQSEGSSGEHAPPLTHGHSSSGGMTSVVTQALSPSMVKNTRKRAPKVKSCLVLMEIVPCVCTCRPMNSGAVLETFAPGDK